MRYESAAYMQSDRGWIRLDKDGGYTKSVHVREPRDISEEYVGPNDPKCWWCRQYLSHSINSHRSEIPMSMAASKKASVSNNALLYSLEDWVIRLSDRIEAAGVAMSAYCLMLNGRIRQDLQRVHPTIFNSLGGDEFPLILNDALFIAANHDPYQQYNSVVWSDTVAVVQHWLDEIESNFDEIVRNAKGSRAESWGTSFASVIHRF